MSSSDQTALLKPRGPFTGSHMLNVKNARQRSENDVNLLRNRLERLRQEERKALKKIEETRRRADQIVSLKTRNEENHMRKLLEAEFANQQLERAKERLKGHRDGAQDAIRQNVEAMAAQKKAEADELRQQSRRISEYVSMQQEQHVERARRINMVSAVAAAARHPPATLLHRRHAAPATRRAAALRARRRRTLRAHAAR